MTEKKKKGQKTTLAAKFKQLEELTQWFEEEDVDLEDALPKFEEGLKLAAECKKELTKIENTVEELTKKYVPKE